MRMAFFVFLLLMWGALNGSFAQVSGPRGNQRLISAVMDRTSFDFSNEAMYKDQNKWTGKTVSFRGAFALHPDILKSERPYAQVDGSNANRDLVNCIVFFDSPGIPSSEDSVQTRTTVATQTAYRVFGIIGKCREVVSIYGVVKILPMLDLLLVFRADDQSLKDPVWISTSLQR